MRTRLATMAVLVAGLAMVVLGSGALVSENADAARDRNSSVRLNTSLKGAEEVPGPGDPDGRGRAQIELLLNDDLVCYDLRAARINPATAAHIHRGASGTAGPVVVNFVPPSDGSSDGCVAADGALLDEIAANPAGFYVNVHNPAFPPGAIRGQLG